MSSRVEAQGPRTDSVSSWYGLIILTVISLFTIIDRPILVLQAETIKEALRLTDTQLGLLQGTGVALFAGFAAYPIAWLAGRMDRRIVLALCLFMGSAAVVGAGLSQNFGQLFAANAFGGAGEAALVPIALSLIPVMFSEARRQLANSIYLLATSAGGSLAMIAGGQLVGAVDELRPHLPEALGLLENWRISFVLAAAGVPIVILLVMTLALPNRETVNAINPLQAPKTKTPAGMAEYIRSYPRTFIGLYGGIGLSYFGFTAVSAWIVVICIRLFDQTPEQVGGALGIAGLLALPAGFGLSISLSKIFNSKSSALIPMMFMRWSWLASAGLLASFLVAPSVLYIYIAIFLIYCVVVTSGMFYPTIIQSISPPPLRARMFAAQLFINALCVAAAPILVGLISDTSGGSPRGLLIASVCLAVPSLIGASLLLRVAEPSVPDVEKMIEESNAEEAAATPAALPASPL